MSQVLGAFGLLDFTMLRPVLAWPACWNLRTVYFFNFQIFFRVAVNCGYWISRYGGTPVHCCCIQQPLNISWSVAICRRTGWILPFGLNMHSEQICHTVKLEHHVNVMKVFTVAGCHRKPSSPLSFWCKALATIAFLVFLCVHLSASVAPNDHRSVNKQACQQLPTLFLYLWRGRSIVRLFVCDVRCLSFPQPRGLCETSVQCNCDHSVVCPDLMLLFHLLSHSFSLSSTRPNHIHSSFIVHTELTVMYANNILTFSPSFNRYALSAILESTLVLPSVAPNLQIIVRYPVCSLTSLLQ
jgi:hypothetical protein